MKWKDFKNRLRKDAQQQKAEVDVDAIWSAIEPQVDAINEEKVKVNWIENAGEDSVYLINK